MYIMEKVISMVTQQDGSMGNLHWKETRVEKLFSFPRLT